MTDSLTDAEFDEMKKRFPHHVTDDDRPLNFPTLLRLVEDRMNLHVERLTINRTGPVR